jgi:hypothetical protein
MAPEATLPGPSAFSMTAVWATAKLRTQKGRKSAPALLPGTFAIDSLPVKW